MKFLRILVMAMVVISCNSTDNYKPAVDALECFREFTDACLKGDFKKAKFYMLADKENEKLLEQIKNDYSKKSKDDKDEYQKASILPTEQSNVTENEIIINYKNSYDRIGRKVKVINKNGIWQVDFKYTFNGNL
jgi:hypothetical protein